MTHPLTPNPATHPVLAVLRTDLTRAWHIEELEARLPQYRALRRTLSKLTIEGVIRRAPGFIATWHAPEATPPAARMINPPDPDSPYGRVTGILVANVGEWVTCREMQAVLPGLSASRLSHLWFLVKEGYVEVRGARNHQEYRMVRLPAVPQTKRTPAPKAAVSTRVRVRATPAAPKAPRAPKPTSLAKSQAALDRADAVRREREDATRRMIQDDIRSVTADLQAHGESTEREIDQRVGIGLGRVRRALLHLTQGGRLVKTGGATLPRNRLIMPDLPSVTPTLTPMARRVLRHLQARPADTELGVAAALGCTRDAVVLALAHLDGLGRVAWSGVGHLIVWRAAADEASQEVAA